MRRIVHIAEIPIVEETGMGRIAWHWREAFQRAGWEFVHIGPDETRKPIHKALWHFSAWEQFKRVESRASAVLVHEPASGIFARHFRGPVVLFSHGIEPRGILMDKRPRGRLGLKSSIRHLVGLPLWAMRRRQCVTGLREADLALLSNQEDQGFVKESIGRSGRTFIFRNGCDLPTNRITRPQTKIPVALFFASWLYRKGEDVLRRAAELLAMQQIELCWVLAGTSLPQSQVLAGWPLCPRDSVKVIPQLSRREEANVYQQADIFVLPSRFEGQPLTLLQAMANGLCCITTDCCGQRDLIAHGRNGLLVPPGSPEALAQAIAMAQADPELRHRLGERAASDIANRSWDAVSDEVVHEVASIIGL